MKRIVAVEIHDFDTGTYVAHSIEECKDKVDEDIFRLVNEHEDIIHIGFTSGIPIWGK